ncbi:MAG: hypothetical protein AAF556_06700 [Pseudomonadota bacterium]
MISRFLGPTTAETTTLEIIGLVTGQFPKRRFSPYSDFAQQVKNTDMARLVRGIDTALRREGRLLQPDIRSFLIDSRAALEPLARSNSEVLIDHGMPGPFRTPVFGPNPDWVSRVKTTQADLQSTAAKLFQDHFADDHASLAGPADRKLAQRIAAAP